MFAVLAFMVVTTVFYPAVVIPGAAVTGFPSRSNPGRPGVFNVPLYTYAVQWLLTLDPDFSVRVVIVGVADEFVLQSDGSEGIALVPRSPFPI